MFSLQETNCSVPSQLSLPIQCKSFQPAFSSAILGFLVAKKASLDVSMVFFHRAMAAFKAIEARTQLTSTPYLLSLNTLARFKKVSVATFTCISLTGCHSADQRLAKRQASCCYASAGESVLPHI